MVQQNLFGIDHNPSDVVLTPEWCAKDTVEWFKPTGKMLDPCKGEGAFHNLMPGSEWCEIREGKDFFEWTTPVDWIISNPPYTILRDWMKHSLKIADEIVYIVPVHKIFNAYGLLLEIKEYGGIKHIRYYGTGSVLKFPMGNAIGVVHFSKGYNGPIGISFYFPG